MNFEVLNLTQGTTEWKAHRASHFNASDAPAMMGSSPNKGRHELVKELASGIERDFSSYVQERVLDKGHTFEAYARPLAECIIGEDLFPVVGKNGIYSASYDGLTMMEDIGFEHKTLNAALREAMHEGCTGESLPMAYQVQMEHQCMVCPSIEKVLFMASEWDRHGNLIEERHCWYYPNLQLRAQIVTGWGLLEKEVAAYDPSAEAAPEVVGQAPDQLPALRIDVTGMVTASNLEGFKAVALRTIGAIKTTLVTDQDFADAEKTVKWCEQVESNLDAAKQHALSQTESIDRLFRTIDEISEQARTVRLKLSKLVKSEKEARKEQIVLQAQRSLDEHINELNHELGATYLQRVAGVFAPVIKGLKSLDSMHEKVQAELARQITEANAKRDSLKSNRQHLQREDGDWITLFPDFAAVGTKAAEDFHALTALRISQHKQAEAARLEAERERIRAEEAAKLQAQAAIEAAAKTEAPRASPETVAEAKAPETVIQQAQVAHVNESSHDGDTLTLGQINALIAPLKVDAAGLEQLGFMPSKTVKAAKHYAAHKLPAMVQAMVTHLQGVLATA